MVIACVRKRIIEMKSRRNIRLSDSQHREGLAAIVGYKYGKTACIYVKEYVLQTHRRQTLCLTEMSLPMNRNPQFIVGAVYLKESNTACKSIVLLQFL